MHGPRTARRTLLPFTLAFGFGALALYVVAYLLVGSCDPVISPTLPLMAGGPWAAVAVTLGLLDGYRHGPDKPSVWHWAAILFISLIVGAGSVVYAFVVCLTNARFFEC